MRRLAAGRSAVVLVALGMILGLVLVVRPVLAATFPDVLSDTHADADYPYAVSILSDLGVFGGFSDGTFRPHDPVTRQQFAKMMVKLLRYQVTGSEVCPFADVSGGTESSDPFYPDKYIAVCAANGIVRGVDATHFAPQANITRAQVLSVVVRAAESSGIALESPSDAYYDGTIANSTFRNLNDPVHGLDVQTAEMNNLVWGIWPDKGNYWEVYSKASRGEVAQILWRLSQTMALHETTTTVQPITTTTSLVPTTTTTVPETTTTTATGPELLYSDYFSNPTGDWPTGTSASGRGSASYEDGRYVLECGPQASEHETARSLDFNDGRMVADVTLIQGADDDYCGVTFRTQDSARYEFGMNGKGYYALYRYGGESGSETLVDWTYSIAVHRAGQTNHVEVTLSGSSISISVNGTLLFLIQDRVIPSGSAGFFVASLDYTSVEAAFDNFEVWSH